MLEKRSLTLEGVADLDKAVQEAYTRRQETTNEYLLAVEEHYGTKFALTMAVDIAYREGAVLGKNERERDAYLRESLPELHTRVREAEAKMWAWERAMKSSEIETERVKLKVTIADIATRS